MMDVPVTHLNNRLAVQLPAELPLGLVFVVGQVEHLHQGHEVDNDEKGCQISFDLVDKKHSIRCELSDRAAKEVRLGEGTRVRAGGHLAFDPQRANYYLLARDIETISDPPPVVSPIPETNGNGLDHAIGRQALTPILADIKRRAESTQLPEAILPYWVQRLAPPEIKKEMTLLEPPPAKTAETPPEPTMDDNIISVLSEAMDSDEDVELTPEMLAKLSPATHHSPLATRHSPLATRPSPLAPRPLPPQQQSLVLPLILLVFAIILLAVLLTFFIL
jgi:hypothetical protein